GGGEPKCGDQFSPVERPAGRGSQWVVGARAQDTGVALWIERWLPADLGGSGEAIRRDARTHPPNRGQSVAQAAASHPPEAAGRLSETSLLVHFRGSDGEAFKSRFCSIRLTSCLIHRMASATASNTAASTSHGQV